MPILCAHAVLFGINKSLFWIPLFEVIITSKNFLLRNIEVHSLLNCYYVQVIHCSQRQGGWLDSSNSAISLQSQPVSQQRQRKATYQHLLQGHILYPLHGVHLQRTVQRQLLRQNVRAIYFNMSQFMFTIWSTTINRSLWGHCFSCLSGDIHHEYEC